MQPKDSAMRKRTQITKTNRVMFIAVAAVSIIVGFALVGAIFLFQKLLFNERVLAQKQKTISTLGSDNAAVPNLESQIRVLNTNQALINSKANATDQAVQVVLDALPSDANSLAFGASLQDKLLANIPNLTINSLEVDPVPGVESLGDDSGSTDITTDQNAISFNASITGDSTALQQALKNIELSIRPIEVQTVKLTSDGSTETLVITGETFYEPAQVVQLTDMTVK